METTPTEEKRLQEQSMMALLYTRLQPEAMCEVTGLRNLPGDESAIGFACYLEEDLVGIWLLYNIKVEKESLKKITISASPIPGFPKLNFDDEVKLIVDTGDYLLRKGLKAEGGIRVDINQLTYHYISREDSRGIADDLAKKVFENALSRNIELKNRYNITNKEDSTMVGRRIIQIAKQKSRLKFWT